jgi:hypothetical protein
MSAVIYHPKLKEERERQFTDARREFEWLRDTVLSERMPSDEGQTSKDETAQEANRVQRQERSE